MRLKKSDHIEVVNHRLQVNGRPFVVEYPDEPVCCIAGGKLYTLLIKGADAL